MSTYVYFNNFIITIFLTFPSISNCLNNMSDDNSNSMPSWPWKQEEFPNPKLHWEHCNNISALIAICDPDTLLTREQIINLNLLLLNIENMTKCDTNCFDQQNPCIKFDKTGLIIGIALAKQIFHQKSSHENTFADGIRNNWQLSKCNNDLIFFIASEKHEMSVSVGTRSKYIFDYSFDQTSEEVANIFDKTSNRNYFEFLMNATKQFAHNFHYRLQLLSLAHDLSSKEDENYESLGSNKWLPWNARQPFATILAIGYCFIITVLMMISCYYCCGKKFKKRHNNSSVSSEQTTKYSELKLNKFETQENS